MNLLVVAERTSTGYPACSSDLPGCVATGAARGEVERETRDALDFHLEGLRADGEDPEPRTDAAHVEVPA